MLILFGIYVGGGLFWVSGFNLISDLCYMHRLKRHGYEILKNRKDYGNYLRNVPRKETTQKRFSVESVVLALFCVVVFFMLNVYNIRYYMFWQHYIKELTSFWLKVQLVMDLFWIIAAFVFFRQRNVKKYRDDVERDVTRKKRMSVDQGIINGIVILVIVITIKAVIANACEYTFRSRGEHDQHYLETIHMVISTAVQDYSAENGMGSDTYAQMLEGCYITDWAKPKDALAQSIADDLGIEDFSELQDKFYVSDGPLRLYLKKSDEEVYIRMENPIRMENGTQHFYEVK